MATDRKSEILDAFIRLVSRFGVDKTTMQDLAKETGLSVGVIYSDFKNKEDLIEAYIGNMGHRLIGQCLKIFEKEMPPERLLHTFIMEMFENVGKVAIEDRGFCQFLQGAETIKVLHNMGSKLGEFSKKLQSMVETILIQGVQEEVFGVKDIPKTARLFLNAFQVYWKEFFVERDLQKTLMGVEEMYLFLIGAIQKQKFNNG